MIHYFNLEGHIEYLVQTDRVALIKHTPEGCGYLSGQWYDTTM
jgi:hypothetical protein